MELLLPMVADALSWTRLRPLPFPCTLARLHSYTSWRYKIMIRYQASVHLLNSEFELTCEVIDVEVRVAAYSSRFLAPATSPAIGGQLDHGRFPTVDGAT